MGPVGGFLSRRGLQFRIVALFLGLLLAVQLASLLLIGSGIERGARASVGEELRTGERIFLRLLRHNAERLTETARLLAADFGFRSAVASRDAETLASALANQAGRIDADIAVFTDSQFQLQAATVEGADRFLPLLRRMATAAVDDDQVVMLEGEPFQLVVVPVRAPLLIGWVAMGFRVQTSLLEEMRSLSMIEVAMLTRRSPETPWRLLGSTLGTADGERFTSKWIAARTAGAARRPADPGALRLHFDEADAGRLVGAVVASEVPLGRDPQQQAVAVLMRSLDDAAAPYRRLQWLLLAFTLAAVAVFAFGSVITARRITTPLVALSASVRRLAAGDYAQAVPAAGDDEIGRLAQAFEAMRQAVRARDLEVRRLAFDDDLTGLPNRERFRSELRDAVVRAGDARPPFSVLMLDLDRFKHVNDVLGHRFGDRLLREVAQRLLGVRRSGDMAARLGGDKFAMLLPGADGDAAGNAARRILHAFETPIALDDHTVDLGAGIGIACFPSDGDQADVLLGRAEVAMYAAKRRQLGVARYLPAQDGGSEESLSLLSELRTAIEEGQLRLWLQPKVSLASGRVVGAEALVRWQHPTRGLVQPMQFIPFAEQTGFIRQVTQWVIAQGAEALSRLARSGSDIHLSINLSVRDLLDQELPEKMQRLAALHGTLPLTLCLEITESAIMDDPQRALQTLERLHALGFKLSIDDFGTGYSSLAYLKRLPVDELKIDKSFVLNMESDLDDAKIVRSVIDLAHNLGLSVVAEGVETAKAWKMLQALGCDEAQGYLVAKPMPVEVFAQWMQQWAAPPVQQVPLDSDFVRLLN
ncbi:EAL domain-containing protein [Methylibium sp.]|uniref:putative bifunctional diguanylate cyclase/phosphodiesterase n=1 Tax=Methylibium sp. TaxID=2067992 RepID=UPI00181EB65A|nr:EAL domain-containing protein [Methylibium sp.]MBA3589915.1 EAL domain-containing protein [Methylibium sp.]